MSRVRYLLRISWLSAFCAFGQNQNIITTVAGGSLGFRGDGGPAIAASIGQPFGLALDPAGNLYGTDIVNSRVYRISPTGILSVIAGDGFLEFSGDGGPALIASVNQPLDVAVDSKGNVYVCDTYNNRIRKITPDGVIATIAGGGDTLGDNGPATKAMLSQPATIALDPQGNLYISDTGHDRVRRVNASGTITTVAGTGITGFTGDGGPATSARLDSPSGIAVDAAGNLYISDRGNNRIRRVNLAGTISTFAGTGTAGFNSDGPATAANLDGPSGLALDAAGNLYFADSRNNRLRRVSPDRTLTTIAGTGIAGFQGDGGPALSAQVDRPSRIALDRTGVLYFADTNNNRIRQLDSAGVITTFAGTGSAKFYGDGGPGRGALLSSPSGLALDSTGAVFIADSENHRIRRLGPDGIITTATGDGGTRTLNNPAAVTFDAVGNMYIADTGNGRIQKVTSTGVASTFASGLKAPSALAFDAGGNLFVADSEDHTVRSFTAAGAGTLIAGKPGTSGFSGDKGPANAATLNSPFGLAFDSAGSLYISDSENNRIRRVTNGVIDTFAGNGQDGFDGEGVVATEARLWRPAGLFFDSAGALYIADRNNSRIRKIQSGVITTFAGRGSGRPLGDGGPASEALFFVPRAVVIDSAGNVFISDNGNDRVRAILATPPALSLSSSSVPLSSKFGGPPTAEQTVTAVSSVPGLPYTLSLETPGNINWLSVASAPLSGTLPVPLQIVADPDGLQPGSYQGAITVTSPATNPPSQTLTVNLTVDPGAPPKASARPARISFALGRGITTSAATSSTRTIDLANDGGGLMDFTAAVSTDSGGDWLKVSPPSGLVSPALPVPLGVTASSAGLDAGTYSGSVSITNPASGDVLTVPVTMTVTAIQQTILLSQTGLTFTAVAQGGAVPSQNFGLLNIGQGVMEWSVEASTSDGSGWLTVTPASGSSNAASLAVPLVDAAVNAANLDPGDYYGRIRVTSPGADNSPQVLTVVLTVLPADSDPGPLVRPTGLIFTSTTGQSPGAQSVFVSNLSGRPTAFTSGRIPQDPNNWFTHAPTDAGISPNQPARVVVQPNSAARTPGFQRGTLTLQFPDGSARTVALLLVVSGGSPPSARSAAAGDCAPSRLLPLFSSLGSGFQAPASWPSTVEVRVVDDCGAPFTSGSVVASFSNGDPSLPLISLKDGRWVGTWRARNAATPQVTLSVSASDPAQSVRGSTQLVGNLRANSAPPFVDRITPPGAGQSAGAPLAPGSRISVVGSGLAAQDASAPDGPLPTELAGTQVLVAGVPLPIFSVSDARVDALMPFDVGVNTRYQLLVRRGSTFGSADLTVAAAQPAVLTVDAGGQGQIYTIADDGARTLADPSSPAKSAAKLAILSTGLGVVDPPVPAGSPAPADSVSNTVNPVAVSIGGVDAAVSSASLLPGAIGVYQVLATVPDGVPTGDAVPVILRVAGQKSSAATMAIR